MVASQNNASVVRIILPLDRIWNANYVLNYMNIAKLVIVLVQAEAITTPTANNARVATISTTMLLKYCYFDDNHVYHTCRYYFDNCCRSVYLQEVEEKECP